MNTASSFTRFLTLANLLSLSRVPLAGVFWMILRDENSHWAPLLVVAIAGITDIFDGKVARRTHDVNALSSANNPGTWLDPVCDKIFVVVILAALLVERSPSAGIFVMILSRELAQLPMALAYRIMRLTRDDFRFDFSATALGKITTALQFASIVSLLLETPATFALALGSCIAGLLAATGYCRRALAALKSYHSVGRI